MRSERQSLAHERLDADGVVEFGAARRTDGDPIRRFAEEAARQALAPTSARTWLRASDEGTQPDPLVNADKSGDSL